MSEAVTVSNRAEFAQWDIEKARAIVSDQGTALAFAARDDNEDELRTSGNALGSALGEALLDVFDGLLEDEN